FEEKFLFTEDCEAWVHGPVYRQIYVRYAAYHFDPIKSIDEFDKTLFSASEFAIIDSIIRNFCCYSGKTLEAFTHLEKPWLKTRNGLPAGAPSDSIIDKDLIGAYFSAVKSKYCMLTPGDIESYSTALFKQIQ
ncbi:MAG: hypothetical protein K0S60_787, partial [Evtepia sp.]|nr:hypothetical protein [Evtepia sp.]